MESKIQKIKRIAKDKKAVFGLTSVQAFFAIILGVALLAYVIVVIMGTLNTSTILPSAANTTINETGQINTTAYTLKGASQVNFVLVTVSAVNGTSGAAIPSSNYTVSLAGVVTNGTSVSYDKVNFSYTFSYQSVPQAQTGNILSNVSTGITGFFSSITPVYAILAILVIILVLVVLVRVVTGSTESRSDNASPSVL